MSTQAFYPFLVGAVCYCCFPFLFFVCSGDHPSARGVLTKHCLHPEGCLPILLTISSAEPFSLMQSHWPLSAFACCAWGIPYRKSLSVPLFPAGGFCAYISVFNPLELISVQGEQQESKCSPSTCGVQLSSIWHFFENLLTGDLTSFVGSSVCSIGLCVWFYANVTKIWLLHLYHMF